MTTALRSIHPRFDTTRLHELTAPRRPVWTPGELRDLTARTASTLREPLIDTARFTSPQRWWTRLALTSEIELWLLTWLPGQGTKPHDHGGAAGAFSVLLGDVAETFRYPAGPIRNHLHVTGAAVGFGGGRAHQMQNLGRVPAATIHAYSPPLVPLREYASLRDVPDEIPSLPTQRGPR
ncbi:MAG: cysteine dioxygenase family protein [Actinomycetota bacterium]|nr:cysteine dioxygenase family protein [Actinomycetota bacterium]